MNYLETFLIGVSLSMDALAVSVALGTAECRKFNVRKTLLTALFFGVFQAVMPLIGWFAGSLCGQFVRTFGAVIAALLLFGIGGNMIRECNEETKAGFGLWKLTVLAFATSIDALLIGLGFACLGRTGILPDVLIIGLTTFAISAAGCVTGRTCGNIFGNKCTIAGGFVLIGIGVKILCFG